MEQLIVIAVFAICAAACVKILSASFFISKETRDVSNAILVAESGAECFRFAGGDIDKVAAILGGQSGSIDDSAAAIVYYDEGWVTCGEGNALYRLYLTSNETGGDSPNLISGKLTVEKITGEELLTFPVAAVAKGGA
jgi:hypothetical protein